MRQVHRPARAARPARRAALRWPRRPPVAEVIGKVQAFYQRTKDLKGNFKQVFTDTLYNRQRTSYGYLYVKKPGMMRWNYVKPEKKSFIADGKELWVYEPEDKQAFRNPLSTDNLSTGLTFLLGKGDLGKEFEASYAEEKLGSPDDLVIKLTPRKPTAQYRYILLVVRAGRLQRQRVAGHRQDHQKPSPLHRSQGQHQDPEERLCLQAGRGRAGDRRVQAAAPLRSRARLSVGRAAASAPCVIGPAPFSGRAAAASGLRRVPAARPLGLHLQ